MNNPHPPVSERAALPARSLLVRTLLVAAIDAVGLAGIIALAGLAAWGLVVVLTIALALINWAYLSPRTQAARWLTPGLVLLLLVVIYPIVYTAYLSLTNYQTGNLLSKEQAIERLEAVEMQTGEIEQRNLAVYRDESGSLAALIGSESAPPVFGLVQQPDQFDPDAQQLLDAEGLVDVDVLQPPASIDQFELLSGLAVVAERDALDGARVALPGGLSAEVLTFTSVRVLEGGSRFEYDAGRDVLIDRGAGRECVSGEGTFICSGVPIDDVQAVARNARGSSIECDSEVCNGVPLFALDQSLAGWRQVVGFDNYAELVQNDRIRAPFLRVFVWNIVFAVATVLLNFALGLGLALVLRNENLRGRSVYRSIFIIPYAIPGFLSILVWRGLLNTQFGQVNSTLQSIGLPEVNWLGSSGGAVASILLVNLWLGFPYMFLISSGALTSIPSELEDAAKVDGASRWRVFRSVTLPLLLISTAPLLIGAFAFNFNNFVLIELLTGGGPPLVGYDAPVGGTDLLISFTFNLANGAGRGSQFALASAIVVLIFLMLGTASAASFRLTKKLETVYD